MERRRTTPLPGGERSTAKRSGEGEPQAQSGKRMDRFKLRARKLRQKQTSAETRLWQALRNRRLARWKFRRQHPIDRYVVDFVTIRSEERRVGKECGLLC